LYVIKTLKLFAIDFVKDFVTRTNSADLSKCGARLKALMRGPIESTYAGPDWKHSCGARLEALVRGPIGSTCAGPDWKHLCGAPVSGLRRNFWERASTHNGRNWWCERV